MSLSKLTRLPVCFSFRVVCFSVWGMTDTEKLSSFVSATVRLIPVSYTHLDVYKRQFMDSSGIGMILGRYKKVTAQGGRVKIRNAGSLVRQLLDLAGVFSLMEYEEDGEETDGK